MNDVKNGPIIADTCNGKGICCPFGTTFLDKIIGDVYNPKCFDISGNVEGCVCFNGNGGPSCTCPKPYDYCEGMYCVHL